MKRSNAPFLVLVAFGISNVPLLVVFRKDRIRSKGTRTTGIEPATFGVTGQYSHQTKLHPLILFGSLNLFLFCGWFRLVSNDFTKKSHSGEEKDIFFSPVFLSQCSITAGRFSGKKVVEHKKRVKRSPCNPPPQPRKRKRFASFLSS
jgi:hypothetical protein